MRSTSDGRRPTPAEKRWKPSQVPSSVRSLTGLLEALERVTKDWGSDPSQWRYGRINQSPLQHMFIDQFSLKPVERPGGFNDVNATGANFRRIIDLADLDKTMATDAPGKYAQPGSPYYGNAGEARGRRLLQPAVHAPGGREAGGAQTDAFAAIGCCWLGPGNLIFIAMRVYQGLVNSIPHSEKRCQLNRSMQHHVEH